jgi:NAD(P)-dependent dehydrogenase (short-subunit alcohol dehydrogenase family)
MPAKQIERTWLITGTSSGLGRSLAEEALRRGARVAATSRRPQQLEDLEAHNPGRLLALAVDLTSPAEVATAVNEVIRQFGRLDAVVCNAGYGLIGAVEELTESDWRAQFDVNFFGVVRIVRSVAPHMRQAGGDIFIVSSSGLYTEVPLAAAYLASKHALVGLTDALRAELDPFGVRVRLVIPGPLRTAFSGASLKFTSSAVDSYATATRQLREAMATMDGTQEGDPLRCAATLCAAVNDPPEERDDIVLGSHALSQGLSRVERDALVLQRARARAEACDFRRDQS